MGEDLAGETWAAVPVIGDVDAEVRVYSDGSWMKWIPRAVIPTLGVLAMALAIHAGPILEAVTDVAA